MAASSRSKPTPRAWHGCFTTRALTGPAWKPADHDLVAGRGRGNRPGQPRLNITLEDRTGLPAALPRSGIHGTGHGPARPATDLALSSILLAKATGQACCLRPRPQRRRPSVGRGRVAASLAAWGRALALPTADCRWIGFLFAKAVPGVLVSVIVAGRGLPQVRSAAGLQSCRKLKPASRRSRPKPLRARWPPWAGLQIKRRRPRRCLGEQGDDLRDL